MCVKDAELCSLLILLLDGAEDVSTDGKWCYLVFWVFGKQNTRWSLLKKRLSECCPSCSSASGISYYRTDLEPPKPPEVFLLKFCCHDRRGLLHGTFLRIKNNALIKLCAYKLEYRTSGCYDHVLFCYILFHILLSTDNIFLIFASCPSFFYCPSAYNLVYPQIIYTS